MSDRRLVSAAARRPAMPGGVQNAAGIMTVFVTSVATLYFGKEVLIPVTLALLLTFVLTPLVDFLRRLHLGRVPSVLLGVMVALGIILALGGIIGSQIANLTADLPQYAATVEKKVESVRSYTVGRLGQITAQFGHQASEPGATAVTPTKSASTPEAATASKEDQSTNPWSVAERYTARVLSPFATLGIVIIVAVFALLQKEDLRDRMIRMIGSDDLHRTTRAIDDGAQRLSRYFLTQVLINAAFGTIVCIGLWIIGLPNPMLWGILSALLRFVPYVGALISAVLPMALAAAVDPGWSMLLWTAGLYVVIEAATGQILEPIVYGNSTGLSPFSVVVAAIFWSWVWGPVGLILSTPLTLCLVVLGRHAKQLEFLDVLLGDRPPLTPVETFYQRMLAGDADEAAANAETILKERSLGIYYDAVVVPAMQLAVADAARGAIDEERLEQVNGMVLSLISNFEGYKDDPPKPAIEQVKAAQPALDTPDVPPQLDPANIPPSTAELPESVVANFPNALCIGGRGPFDETASTIVVQLLGKHHVAARLATYQEASRERVASLDTEGIAIVCISCLDLSRSPANLRYLIQRLRSKLPRDAKIVVGLGGGEDNEATRNSIGADVITNSLEESVARCVKYAVIMANAETHTEAKSLAAVLPFKPVVKTDAVEESIR